MENTTDAVRSCRHVYNLSTSVCRSRFRGHNVYKRVWSTSVGAILQHEREARKREHPYVVTVVKDGFTVGHVLRTISGNSHFFVNLHSFAKFAKIYVPLIFVSISTSIFRSLCSIVGLMLSADRWTAIM